MLAQVAQRCGARVGRGAGAEGSRRAGGDLPRACGRPIVSVGGAAAAAGAARVVGVGELRRAGQPRSSSSSAAWKAIGAEGERRVMLLSGEPGIGKTTLSARAFACSVYEQGGAVVYGRCDEDLGIPYQPWIEALDPSRRDAPLAVLAAHVADRGGHLARLVPELARRPSVERPAGGDADSERFVLFGCVVDLLARVSGEPDRWWCSTTCIGPTGQRPAAAPRRRVATRPMRVGCSGRSATPTSRTDHPLADLLAALHREKRRRADRARGASTTTTCSHLLETRRRPRDGRTRRRVARRACWPRPRATRSSWPRSCATSPRPARSTRRTTAAGSPTPTCGRSGSRSACARSSAVASPGSARTPNGSSGSAAVIGRDFDIALLAAVAQIDEDTVIDLCDAAVEAAVLQTTDDPDRYTFAHALIEHTLYDGLSPARRSRAHRAVAEHLEALAGPDGETASVSSPTTGPKPSNPADTAKAIHYAQLAGDRARDQLAPDDAIRWYAQALDLDRTAHRSPDRRQRVEILIGLGDAERQSGVAAHREHLLEAADAGRRDRRRRPPRPRRARQLRGFGAIGQPDHERIAMIGTGARQGPATTTPTGPACSASSRASDLRNGARRTAGDRRRGHHGGAAQRRSSRAPSTRASRRRVRAVAPRRSASNGWTKPVHSPIGSVTRVSAASRLYGGCWPSSKSGHGRGERSSVPDAL